MGSQQSKYLLSTCKGETAEAISREEGVEPVTVRTALKNIRGFADELLGPLDWNGKNKLASYRRYAIALGLLTNPIVCKPVGFPVSLAELKLPIAYAGWKRSKEVNGHIAVYSTDLNQLLGERSIGLEISDGYSLPANAVAYRNQLLSVPRLNEDKVRLASDLLPGSLSVQCQKTDYVNGLATNELVNYELWNQDQRLHLASANEWFLRGDTLLTLEQSMMSNHIGVGALVFTIDGHFVVTEQARGSDQQAERIAPGGSGSADWDQLRISDSLNSFVLRETRREFMEEGTTVRHHDHHFKKLLDCKNCWLIGYWRRLNRGGKPDFMSLLVAPITKDQLKVRTEEASYTKWVEGYRVDISNSDHLLTSVKKIVDSFQPSKLTLDLILGLQYLQEWLSQNNNERTLMTCFQQMNS